MTRPTTDAALTGEREITLTRTFDAPRELVFEAWSKPEHLPRWMCPRDFTITTHEIDVREGGIWRYLMHGPDGTDYGNRIHWLEIAPPERLVFWHGDDLDDDPNAFHVTVTLSDIGGRTEIAMRMVFPTAEQRDEAVGFGAVELGYTTLDKLADLIDELRA